MDESESQKLQRNPIMEGSPSFVSFDALGKGEGENNLFEIVQSILFFLIRSVCPQEKLFDRSLTDLGYRT